MDRATIIKYCDELGIELVSKMPNSAGWLPALCPFAEFLHDGGKDRHASFFLKVNPTGVTAGHCFTCKTRGRMSSLIRQLGYHREEDYSRLIIEADLEDIPSNYGEFDDTGEVVGERIPIEEDAYWTMFPLAWTHPDCRRYLQYQRIELAGGYGLPIGKDACETMGLRYDPEEKRVLFPVRGRGGDLYGWSGRSTLPSKYFNEKHPRLRDYEFDKSLCLLGEHLFQQGKPLLVVEGLFAYATMIELGVRTYCNPVAIMGSTLTDSQKHLLIEMNEPVYLLLDKDAAGERGLHGDPSKGIEGAIDKLRLHVPTRVCTYPADVYDPDDLTKDEVARMISHDYEQY